MRNNKEITGRIILSQEQRFRIVDQKGRSFLFDLSHRAPVNIEELSEWAHSGRWVRVSYEGEPETESGIAHSIKAA